VFRLRSWCWACAVALLLAVALLFAAAPQTAEAQRAAVGPPDWPCVQRLIPELAWETIWTGPPIDELEQAWWEDEEIGRVVRLATAPGTSTAEALGLIGELVDRIDEDREHRLTLLFAGVFEQTNRERGHTIDAIRRYARGQVGRLERIGTLVDELEELRRNEGHSSETVARWEEELFWERRVFEDRQASLRALCDQPYLLEEQLSRMVRVIQAELRGDRP
jgi:hypothetical protein